MTDRKRRLCADADHSELVLAVRIEMPGRERPQRCPSLPAERNVLSLFFTNCALSRRDTARGVLGAAGRANERVHLALQNIRLLQLDYSLIPNRTRRAQARSWLTCSSAGDDAWAETGIGPAAQLKCIFSSSRLCRLRVGVAECYPLFSANLDITTWRRSDLRGDPLITPILEAINSSRDHPLITGMGRR